MLVLMLIPVTPEGRLRPPPSLAPAPPAQKQRLVPRRDASAGVPLLASLDQSSSSQPREGPAPPAPAAVSLDGAWSWRVPFGDADERGRFPCLFRCSEPVACDRLSTGNLQRHIANYHKELYDVLCASDKNKRRAILNDFLGRQKVDNTRQVLIAGSHYLTTCRESLVQHFDVLRRSLMLSQPRHIGHFGQVSAGSRLTHLRIPCSMQPGRFVDSAQNCAPLLRFSGRVTKSSAFVCVQHPP